jgi:hypothetical protein
MTEFDDKAIEQEAYRLWEQAGRQIWGNAHDYWHQAIENLRARSGEQKGETDDAAHPEGSIGISKA